MQPLRRSGERLRPGDRVRRRPDYLNCYRRGRRRYGSLVILYSFPNAVGAPRLGITVSRKVGGSVQRQRFKRRVREIFRRWSGRDDLPSVDLVVHAKPGAADAEFAELATELQRLFASRAAR